MRTSLRANLGNTTFVPFLQASRPLHYLEYFLKGVGIAAYGIERELLASEGKLARRWMLWCITALVAFGAAAAIAIARFSATSSPQVWETIGGVTCRMEPGANEKGVQSESLMPVIN